jgi:ATP phosphoribosyltransferase
VLRLSVPSDGPLYEPALAFLRSCGIGLLRTNLRRYTAAIPTLPGVTVHFQRGSDIGQKVEEGSADVGIMGRDRFLESREEGGNSNIVIENLGFGHSELVIAIPDSWVDVTSLADLADVAMEFREQGKDLRIATKYPRLTERFLLSGGVNYFSIVPSSGTLEAAPSMGYADIIADISITGVTLRENRLKAIHGGSIMASEACLISNVSQLAGDPDKLDLAKSLVGRIEAHLQAVEFYSVTANLKGEDPEDVAGVVLRHADISGLRGPTISKVYTLDGDGWYAVTVIVERERLLDAVERLREIGGSSVTVSQPDYVFHSQSRAVDRLTNAG